METLDHLFYFVNKIWIWRNVMVNQLTYSVKYRELVIRKQVFPLIFRACVPNLPVYISRHSKMTVLWSFAFSLFSKQIFQVMASRRDPGGPRKLLETIREKQVRWSNVKRQFSLQVCTTRCKNVIHLNSRMSRSKYNLPVLIQAWQDILLCF